MGVEVVTFGCRLNAYESEVVKSRAAEAGLRDVLIINSCAVTGEAVRQARQAVRRARRADPGRPIIVTGCAAQTEAASFAAMPEVDLVLGNADKLAAEAYRELPAATPDFGISAAEKLRVNDIMSVRESAPQLVDGFADRARAFVQVQNGCDHRCTFCIIPYGRGPSRSVPMGAVVEQVRILAEGGYREIVLTGVDLTSYGGDLPGSPRLGKLVRTVLRLVPDLPRLRLSSIDLVEADPDLMRAFADEERLMPYLHLSLQSGDDLILKRMKRRHLRADAVRFCTEARRLRPDITFGADLIAGFPTETEAMFAGTRDLVEDCGLTFLHVFPFSPRTGTPAARMPQVAPAIRKARAAALRAAGDRALAIRLAADIDATRSVLVERPGFGRTEHFLPVHLDGGEPGRIVPMRILSADRQALSGTPSEGTS